MHGSPWKMGVATQPVAPRSWKNRSVAAVWTPVGTELSWFTAAVATIVADLPTSVNEPDAPPTFLPFAVVTIVAAAAGWPFSVTFDENVTFVVTTLMRFALPFTLTTFVLVEARFVTVSF